MFLSSDNPFILFNQTHKFLNQRYKYICPLAGNLQYFGLVLYSKTLNSI
jgi:hypothetical protein